MTLSVNSINRRTLLGGAVAVTLVSACRAAQPSPGEPRTRPGRQNLYHCEGCDGISERPAGGLPASIVMAEREKGTPLIVEGRTFQSDGRTPAPGIILYIYHTNSDGFYANGSPKTEWSRRHGRIRGWLKTDADGRYRVATIKPAPYPNRGLPAHLHFTVLEPRRRPYYIDDVVFDDEYGVTPTYRKQQELRGGSGIVKLTTVPNGTSVAHRDIILEHHP